MLAFLQSLVLIALAEMGDKTQLVALAFATRSSARVVLAGVFAATLVVHLLSVAIGEALGLVLPTFWLTLAAGAAFIGLGLTAHPPKLDSTRRSVMLGANSERDCNVRCTSLLRFVRSSHDAIVRTMASYGPPLVGPAPGRS